MDEKEKGGRGWEGQKEKIISHKIENITMDNSYNLDLLNRSNV